jgi:hypothetical protein
MFHQAIKSDINNALHTISNEINNFHVDYMNNIIFSCYAGKCTPQFLETYFHLLISMFQNYFKLSQDKKTVGLQYTEEIEMVQSMNSWVADYYNEDDKFIGAHADTYNEYEQWLLYLLVQYVQTQLDIENNLWSNDEPQVFLLLDDFKKYYPENYEYFHKQLPTVTVSFLFNTIIQTDELTLVNQQKRNSDRRSTDATDFMLDGNIDDIKIKRQLDEKCPTIFTVKLKDPTVFEVMFSFLKCKSGKFDRWYEMYSNISYNKSKDQFIVDFDHGS